MHTSLSPGLLKTERMKAGLSQEALADLTGLSLRTIQRLENGETNPRGHSLRKLKEALGAGIHVEVQEHMRSEPGVLLLLHLSALSVLAWPPLGILLPLLFWLWKKDSIAGLDKAGRHILNFELSWMLVLILLYVNGLVLKMFHVGLPLSWGQTKLIILGLYILNILVIIVNACASYFKKNFWHVYVIRFF